MTIVRLTGGLCNTMFMYAFGRSLSVRKNVSVDFHWCRSTWDYSLGAYNVKPNLVEPFAGMKVYNEKSTAHDPEVLNAPEETYFKGYWQSEKYFEEDVIRKELVLSHPTEEMLAKAKEIRNYDNSVFIHVRHGDYLTTPETNAYHGVLPYDYYIRAIDYMRTKVTNPEFFVFSDDIDWCRTVGLPGTFINAGLHGDLYLMRCCKHAIIANSSYSWFGAWLGKAEIVMVPKPWFRATASGDIIPERWKRI
jgi:hypothetical protein